MYVKGEQMTDEHSACDNCRFFFEHPAAPDGPFCRRYAPRPGWMGDGGATLFWPRTRPDWSCGQHARSDDAKPHPEWEKGFDAGYEKAIENLGDNKP
jgi:hypothetical protein